MTKEELIEDYERRLKNINKMINSLKKETNPAFVIAVSRYKTKRGCYRAFLTELKRLDQ